MSAAEMRDNIDLVLQKGVDTRLTKAEMEVLNEHIRKIREGGENLVTKKRKQLSQVEDVYILSSEICGDNSYREGWKQVYTTKCSVCQERPCGECRDCRTRMVQAAMVVLAAQGVSDKIILPHLGAVFRHSRYVNLSMEEWGELTVHELAAIFKKCSCHCKNAFALHNFIQECLEYGPPTTLEDIECIRAFSKKSGCLWLKAVFNIDFGVPSDSHVLDSAKKLRWVPQSCQATLCSHLIECFVPREMWEMPNIYLAGLRQNLAENSMKTHVILTCASYLGREHLELVKQILPKSYKRKELSRHEQDSFNKTYLPRMRDILKRGDWKRRKMICSGEKYETRNKDMPRRKLQTLLPGASRPEGDVRLPVDKRTKEDEERKAFWDFGLNMKQVKLTESFKTRDNMNGRDHWKDNFRKG